MAQTNNEVLITAPLDNIVPAPAVFEDTAPPADTKYIIVKRGIKTYAEGVWYINQSNCTSISTGTFTATIKPKHGNLAFEDETLPVPFGPCTGTPLPATIAYYTWHKESAPA